MGGGLRAVAQQLAVGSYMTLVMPTVRLHILILIRLRLRGIRGVYNCVDNWGRWLLWIGLRMKGWVGCWRRVQMMEQ